MALTPDCRRCDQITEFGPHPHCGKYDSGLHTITRASKCRYYSPSHEMMQWGVEELDTLLKERKSFDTEE